LNHYQFNGFRFVSLNQEKLTETLSAKSKGHSVHFVAASTFFGSRKDPDFSSKLKDAILIADSKPLQTYFKFKYGEFEGIRGSDFLRYYSLKSNANMILIGSEKKVTDELISKLKLLNPKVRIALVINPPFKPDLSEESIHWEKEILKHSADVVWVGLGSPKQDYIARQLATNLNIHVIAAGAAFEFVSSVLPEAPGWMISSHIEWLHRLIIEPKRLWKRYFFGNLYFIYLLIRDLVFSKNQ